MLATPTNLYRPNDNYALKSSYVLPAQIRKAHKAKLPGDTRYVVGGLGKPMREFLYVDEMVDVFFFLIEHAEIQDGTFN